MFHGNELIPVFTHLFVPILPSVNAVNLYVPNRSPYESYIQPEILFRVVEEHAQNHHTLN